MMQGAIKRAKIKRYFYICFWKQSKFSESNQLYFNQNSNTMRKLFLAAALALFSLGAMAQNLQLHYDFGEGRKMLTTTVEMFHLDDYGSTFFFIDMDYGSENSGIDGIDLTYWEIARSFKIGDLPVQPRVEYNGGFGRNTFGGFGLSQSYLVGAEKTFLSKDFSKFITAQLNYKYIDQGTATQSSFQVTAVWGMNFLDDKLTFSGFADFWMEDAIAFMDAGEATDFIFMSEPQLWYHLNSSFSVGGEVELSNNFAGYLGFKVRPTLGVKWNIAPTK